jgi:hypothetical protein
MITVIEIIASVECEGCGKPFAVSLRTDTKLANYRDLPDAVKDAVRCGASVNSAAGECSILHDLCLCGKCTSITDRIGSDDVDPSLEETIAALEAALAEPVLAAPGQTREEKPHAIVSDGRVWLVDKDGKALTRKHKTMVDAVAEIRQRRKPSGKGKKK